MLKMSHAKILLRKTTSLLNIYKPQPTTFVHLNPPPNATNMHIYIFSHNKLDICGHIAHLSPLSGAYHQLTDTVKPVDALLRCPVVVATQEVVPTATCCTVQTMRWVVKKALMRANKVSVHIYIPECRYLSGIFSVM